MRCSSNRAALTRLREATARLHAAHKGFCEDEILIASEKFEQASFDSNKAYARFKESVSRYLAINSRFWEIKRDEAFDEKSRAFWERAEAFNEKSRAYYKRAEASEERFQVADKEFNAANERFQVADKEFDAADERFIDANEKAKEAESFRTENETSVFY